MKKFLVVLCWIVSFLFVLLLHAPGISHATPLAEFEINALGGFGSITYGDPRVTLKLVLTDSDDFISSNRYFIFEDVILESSIIGSTFIATSATDPGFDAFAAVLTDGEDDYFWAGGGHPMFSGYGLGGQGWESDLLSGEPGFTGVDLNGNHIGSISLTINNFTIEDMPYGAENELIGYEWSWNATVSINPVPEPATMLLLGTGLIGLAGIGRKKFFKK